MTPQGVRSAESLIAIPTEVSIRLTAEKLPSQTGVGYDHAQTLGNGEFIEEGQYKGLYQKSTLTVSTAKLGDRLDGAGDQERIGAVATHDADHNNDARQIEQDLGDKGGSPAVETRPVKSELLYRREYKKLYPEKADQSDYEPRYEGFIGPKEYKKVPQP